MELPWDLLAGHCHRPAAAVAKGQHCGAKTATFCFLIKKKNSQAQLLKVSI